MKIDVKGKVESAYVEAPFDQALKALKKEKYNLISLEENAQLRIQEGKDAFISQNGNYVKEGVIYLPSKEVYLTKISPIIQNAQEATECHRKGKEFYLNKSQTEKALKDAVKFPKNSNYEIPTSEFGNDAITAFAFGKIAKDYGNFLKEAGINAMPVWLASCENKPFARQMWFGRLGSVDGSGLDGGRGLDCSNSRARGVRSNAEGVAQKISNVESYTPKQISSALKGLGINGLEKQILESLRK
jgi:hypothetical protein